jgi:hypothetical protein
MHQLSNCNRGPRQVVAKRNQEIALLSPELTDKSFCAITYETCRKFMKTLDFKSLRAVTYRQSPSKSLGTVTYVNRGGGGMHNRVRNSLILNDRRSNMPSFSPTSAGLRPRLNTSALQLLKGLRLASHA